MVCSERSSVLLAWILQDRIGDIGSIPGDRHYNTLVSSVLFSLLTGGLHLRGPGLDSGLGQSDWLGVCSYFRPPRFAPSGLLLEFLCLGFHGSDVDLLLKVIFMRRFKSRLCQWCTLLVIKSNFFMSRVASSFPSYGRITNTNKVLCPKGYCCYKTSF